MVKNTTIVFQISNLSGKLKVFNIPFSRRKEFEDIYFDIKVNAEWYKNILPNKLNLEFYFTARICMKIT
jgi:hypothetical protein